MNRCLTSFRWILGALPALIFSTQIYAVDHIQVGLRSGQASLIKKSVTYQTTLKDANQSIKLVEPFFRDATNLLPSEAQQLWDLYFHPSRQQDLSLASNVVLIHLCLSSSLIGTNRASHDNRKKQFYFYH